MAGARTVTNMAEKEPQEDLRDLGFGGRVSREARGRLLNRDGSFNVERHGLPWLRSRSPYHALITMSWPEFFLLLVVFYVLTNALFAMAYFLCGPGALAGSQAGTFPGRFWDAFFFSVHTLATIGYGTIHPVGMPANIIVAVEALVGLLGFAMATGLVFARFSRPQARILFSRVAVVAPFREGRAFMFRIVNLLSTQLLHVEARIVLAMVKDENGRRVRRFVPLELERETVVFFPLSWTIVHPITEASPLHGLTADDLRRGNAEFIVLLSAVDEASAQTVHARTSYGAQEIQFGARFKDMFEHAADGSTRVDVHRIHDTEPAAP
jgi:inward rectifier potassium channel